MNDNLQFQQAKTMIASIQWKDYDTIGGNAAESAIWHTLDGRQWITPNVEILLRVLFSENIDAALDASHELWNCLCHQGQTASADLPAYDILLLGVRSLTEPLKVELMDILYNIIGGIPKSDLSTPWKLELRTKFARDRWFFQTLTNSKNEDIAAFAELILDQL